MVTKGFFSNSLSLIHAAIYWYLSNMNIEFLFVMKIIVIMSIFANN